MDANTTYECSNTSWTVQTACDDGTPDWKLIIEQSDSYNAVFIESGFMVLDSNNYTIEAWCINDTLNVSATNTNDAYLPNTCPSGFTAWDFQCIDPNVGDCAPEIVGLYFNMDDPEGISFNATWADMTSECIINGTDGCICSGTSIDFVACSSLT